MKNTLWARLEKRITSARMTKKHVVDRKSFYPISEHISRSRGEIIVSDQVVVVFTKKRKRAPITPLIHKGLSTNSRWKISSVPVP